MDASVRSTIFMGLVFAVSQLGAMVLAWAFIGKEMRVFENPNDPLIPIYYIIAVLLFTLAVLYIIRKHKENIVRIIFLGAVAYTIFFVFLLIIAKFVGGIVSLPAAIVVAGIFTYYLIKKPEWYVIDAAGVVMAIGVIGIFGVSLSILPVMVLLIALAVYDAVSVYGTKHMLALADGVTRMRLPILLVIPKKRGYSFLKQKPLMEQLEEGEEREAMFMGLGDVIIPGVLMISAFNFLPEKMIGEVSGSLLVALGTLLGSLVGFAILMTFVLRGRPQAGLPLLNGGAIVGYLLSYLLVYGSLSFGISLPW
ncbi:MAG: presenilin family intramembrane aspartyl protease PSH [Thermoplasmata archaeon]